MAIKFFGPEDRKGKKRTGEIRSEYPAWYHPVRIEMLQESVNKDQRMLDSGAIDRVPNTEQFRQDLERRKVLLETIKDAKPVLTGKDKDRAASAYKSLGDQIRDYMPTRTDMKKGLANPHHENKLDSSPCVDVQGFVDIARECGVNVPTNENKISRKQAARVWKILGMALGERTNTEYLRRDNKSGTYHSERDIDQMIREDS